MYARARACVCVCVRVRTRVCVCAPLPRQVVQQSLEFVTQQSDQTALDVGEGHVDHEDVGGGAGWLIVLQERPDT